MKRGITMILLLAFCLAPGARGETLCFYQCVDRWDAGLKVFKENHPEVEFAWTEEYYPNASSLAGKLLTRELQCDLMGVTTNTIDAKTIMSKGYFADLSESAVIEDTLARMVPSIADAAMLDGKIYALPTEILFDYWAADAEGWRAAGLDMKDVPDSFPAFLDFLDAWCARVEREPEYNIRVWYGWDDTVYGRASYPELLTEMLINSVMMQKEYAGEALAFEGEALVKLLERAKLLGERVYDTESAGAAYTLFKPVTRPEWPRAGERIVSLRLSEDEPSLVRVILRLVAVSGLSDSTGLCSELLEMMAQHLPEEMAAYLFMDGQPVKNANNETNIAKTEAAIAGIEEKLKNPSLDQGERGDLESDLNSYSAVLEALATEESRYLVSPEQLSNYRQFAGALFVASPGIFDPGTESYASALQLIARFAGGQISAREFAESLNHLARMARMEEF